MQHWIPVLLQHEPVHGKTYLPPAFPWTFHESICLQSGFGLSSLAGGSVLSLLDGTTVLAGLTCDPITVIGALTGSSCTQQTVCCTDTSSVSLYYALFHSYLAIFTDAYGFFFSPCRPLWSTSPATTLACEVDVGYPLYVLAVSFILLDIGIITSRLSGLI